ncbi:hypothetical protein [Paraburkholderia sp. Ac-20347]|uniref:hypothetical protein n=1 Tax=Paraburkholderia sp. Ac-20347 TaxID=2703892 RepID=UPI00197F70F7|nr:hypothetical protein [Paraburkholderia sp. Ac-20347]MBN3809436.1 hypothetical protein [Paraburkholderia sp. Ac-20347]
MNHVSQHLPADAIAALTLAAAEAKKIADPAMRAARIDLAIYYVRTTHPQYFKE